HPDGPRSRPPGNSSHRPRTPCRRPGRESGPAPAPRRRPREGTPARTSRTPCRRPRKTARWRHLRDIETRPSRTSLPGDQRRNAPPTQRRPASTVRPAWTGRARRISFSTPDGEVNGVAPVKFMATNDETAAMASSSANAAGASRAPRRHITAHAARTPPATPPWTEKARPGSQGRSPGVTTAPARIPAASASTAGTPRCHAAPREKRPGPNPAREKPPERRSPRGTQHPRDLDRRQAEPIDRGKNDPPHRRSRLHPGIEERSDVPDAYRTVCHREAAPFPDLVGGDAGRP